MSTTTIAVPTIAPETHEHPTLGAYTIRYTVAPSSIGEDAARLVPLTRARVDALGILSEINLKWFSEDRYSEVLPCDAEWCPARVSVHAVVLFASTAAPWTIAVEDAGNLRLPQHEGCVWRLKAGYEWSFQITGAPGEPLSVVLHRARTLVMDPAQPLGLAMTYADAHARESAARRAELTDLLSR